MEGRRAARKWPELCMTRSNRGGIISRYGAEDGSVPPMPGTLYLGSNGRPGVGKGWGRAAEDESGARHADPGDRGIAVHLTVRGRGRMNATCRSDGPSGGPSNA